MKRTIRQIYSLLPDGDLMKICTLFAMMIFASVISLIGVGTVPVFVSSLIDAERILNYPVLGDFLEKINVTTPQQLVLFGAFVLLSIYLFKNLFMLFYNYMNSKFMLNRVLYLQNRIFRAYMKSPYTFFISRNSSELLRNINSEVSKIIDGTLKPVLQISLNVITTVVIVGGLIAFEPLITGLGMIFFGGFTYLFLRLTKKNLPLWK